MKMIKKFAGAFVAIVVITGIVVAQVSTTTEPEADAEIQKIREKYQAEYRKIEERNKQLSDDAPKGDENITGIDVDLSRWQTVSFDIPEFRMNTKKIAFDIPEVTMRIKRFVISKPETRMVRHLIGKKPVIIRGKLEYRPIYISKPEFRMNRHEVKISIPEFKKKRVETSIKIPEVYLTKRVSFRTPVIRVRTTREATDETESGAEEIQKLAESLVAAETTEIKALSKKRLIETRRLIEEEYKTAVKHYTSAIEDTVKSGIDPTKIVGEDGVTENLPEQLATSSKEFTDALEKIDAALANLDKP